jgi:ectoine hydroxylase-related dioxygenase (phytanoyl-CoA dioxygenase family)
METASPYKFEDVLRDLEVDGTLLSPGERRALDEQGYLILHGIIDRSWVNELCAAFEEAVAADRQTPTGKESGTRHPVNLLNRSKTFHGICAQPKAMAAIHHILRRPFRLSQFSGRDPLPGYGQQGLHTDWMPRAANEPAWVVTAIWMLDDFTKDNGATRIVPGTHRLPGQIPKAMADPSAHHPDELIVVGQAGSVLLFNGHLWHSGTRNNSRGSRRALQSVFWAREAFPPYAEPLCDRRDGLTPAVRYILGL